MKQFYFAAAMLWASVGGYGAFAQAPGTLDATFGTAGVVQTAFSTAPTSDEGHAVAVQPDGKIVVAGESSLGLSLVRYLPDGTLDATFGTGGQVATDFGPSNSGLEPDTRRSRAYAVAVQPDGKVVAGGRRGAEMVVARYLPNGLLDTSFGTGGRFVQYYATYGSGVERLFVRNDGFILAISTNYSLNINAMSATCLTPTGMADRSYGPGGTGTTIVWPDQTSQYGRTKGLLDSNNRVVLVGMEIPSGSPITTQPQLVMARLTSTGRVDTSFGVGGEVKYGVPDPAHVNMPTVAEQPDGKLVVASTGFVMRFNSNGTVDSSFGTNGYTTFTYPSATGNSSDASTVHIQPNGSIVVAGTAAPWSNAALGVARFLPNGTPDTAFGTNGAASFTVDAYNVLNGLAAQADGRLLLVGMAATSRSPIQNGRFVTLRLNAGIVQSTHAALGPDQLSVYPNPASSQLHVAFHRPMPSAMLHLTLCNALGQVVREQATRSLGSTVVFNTQGLAAGAYTLRVESEAGTATRWVLLQ